MISLQSVSKTFGGQVAACDVTLEIATGDAMALVGSSGSGKTTLLRLIAGLDTPDAGTIVIDGHVVSSPSSVVQPSRRDIGLVFQQPALWPHMTAAQNVAFGAKGSRAERAHRAMELLELVGLAGFGDRRPHQLSGGEGQRVALARALAPDPAILLLDEPFANLDESLSKAMIKLVDQTRHRLGATLIYVSHDRDTVRLLCSNVAEMETGRLSHLQTSNGSYLYSKALP
jgi:iron(III) transport system ATP-binding protein